MLNFKLKINREEGLSEIDAQLVRATIAAYFAVFKLQLNIVKDDDMEPKVRVIVERFAKGHFPQLDLEFVWYHTAPGSPSESPEAPPEQ